MANQLFRVTGNRCQKPYKTNCISAPFAPKSEKELQKHWKSITCTRFSDCVFEKPRNLIKLMENRLFRVTDNRCQKPYKTNCILALFPPNAKKSTKTLKKHYLHKVFAMRFREAAKPYKTNGKQRLGAPENQRQQLNIVHHSRNWKSMDSRTRNLGFRI